MIALPLSVKGVLGFEWDKGNLNKNRLKHGVDPKECEEVFLSLPLIILFDEKHSQLEKRYKVYGVSSGGRRLALAITLRDKKIRIIMARDQSKKEKRTFEKENKESGGEKYGKA